MAMKGKSLHDDDVVVRNSMRVHDLVGVAYVRLVVEDLGGWWLWWLWRIWGRW